MFSTQNIEVAISIKDTNHNLFRELTHAENNKETRTTHAGSRFKLTNYLF